MGSAKEMSQKTQDDGEPLMTHTSRIYPSPSQENIARPS
jgi:hypothetical protein